MLSRKRRKERAGKKSPQKEYKKRMKGEEEDEDGRPPNVTGSITFTPSAPSSSSSLNQQSAKKKERKTMAFSSSQQISIAVSACTLVLAILFDQIGKRRRRNRLKNDQKKKVKDCGAFVEIVDIPCPPPPEKHVVRKLANLKFVLKDIFEVSGRKDENDSSCGFGSPKWKEFMKEKRENSNSNGNNAGVHRVKNAAIMDMLLKNGASLVGITHMDELAYSIDGQNEHYGTPINPAADKRLPGGSSSGSAVAVASRLRDCDFGIGTDSAGSVRVPAAYCGVYGFRPSHGMVSTKGCQDFAKTFDTVGWFAKGSKTLKDVGDVLLKPADDEKYGIKEPKQFAILTDLMKLADPQGSAAVASALKAFGYDDRYAGKVSKLDLGERLKMLCPSLRTDTSGKTGLELIRDKMHATMGFEIHEALKEFLAFLEKQDGDNTTITKKTRSLGKFTAQRIENAKKITEQDYENLMKVRGEIREVMDQIMDNGTVLIFPTVPGVAPMREGRSEEEVQAWRMKTFQFLAIASFCGLPQVAIPLRYPDAEGPHSVSLLGGFQTDKMLLECAFRYSAQMQEHFPNYVITEMMKSNPAPKVPGEEEKVNGNKAFAEGKYEDAISWYDKALEKKKLPAYYANRALVYLKMGKMEEVEKDCTEALEMDGKYVKAYLRRAKARMILGSFLEAAMDYEEALRLEPTNREARSEMANMQKHLESGAMDASMPKDDLEIARSFI